MKHFYKDPLAAAWMAKHFGMEFFVRYKRFDGIVESSKFTFSNIIKYTTDKWPQTWVNGFYIRPDSLHILEPEVGDDLQFPDYDQVKRYTDEECVINEHYRTRDWEATASHYGQPKIIQRNGIAFMWPESEEE